jgi:hypothetical protein
MALRRQRDHDRRVLLSLRLMGRGRLGQHQLVQLAKTVGDRSPIERHDEFVLPSTQPGLGAGARRPGSSGKWSRWSHRVTLLQRPSGPHPNRAWRPPEACPYASAPGNVRHHMATAPSPAAVRAGCDRAAATLAPRTAARYASGPSHVPSVSRCWAPLRHSRPHAGSRRQAGAAGSR